MERIRLQVAVFCGVLLTSALASAASADKKGCADHPLFPTRMAGYFIEKCDIKEFDAANLDTGKREKLHVEGRVTKLTYRVAEGTQEPGKLTVVKNYETAFKSIGGQILYINDYLVNGTVNKDGKTVWFESNKGNGKIWLTVVEKAGMAQDIVASATIFSNDIKNTGHAAVYGIYFDTGKSEVKPESKAALDEVAKLLTGDPSLKLMVVGHTDSTGQLDANMKLSEARAQAVVQALFKGYGIATSRMQGRGAGPIAPVATNRTDEGRAKNRRVELVEQ